VNSRVYNHNSGAECFYQGNATEHVAPRIKSWFENVPLLNIASSSLISNLSPNSLTPAQKETAICLTRPRSPITNDKYARLSAWIGETVLSSSFGVEDFTHSASLQSTYYTAVRNNLLTETLVIQVANYNSIASVVNSLTGSFEWHSPIVDIFLGQLNMSETLGIEDSSLPAKMDTGIRPLSAWLLSLSALDATASAVLTAAGITPSDYTDFPSPFASLLTTKTLYGVYSGGSVSTTITPPPSFISQSLLTTFDQQFTSSNVFTTQWLTFDDRQTLEDYLAVPLPPVRRLGEIATLEINDATFNILDGGLGVTGTTSPAVARAFGFVNSPTGDWRVDVANPLVIRSDMSVTDNNYLLMTDTVNQNLYNITFGGIEKKWLVANESFIGFYPSPGTRGTQEIDGAKWYVYQCRGTTAQNQTIIYPRNYNSYQSPFVTSLATANSKDVTGWVRIPRVENNTVELSSSIFQPMTEGDNIISSPFANGLLYITEQPRGL